MSMCSGRVGVTCVCVCVCAVNIKDKQEVEKRWQKNHN